MPEQPDTSPGPELLTPGVHRLRLPLGSHSIDHVNVYLLEAAGGPLLIDTGWSEPATRTALTHQLHQLGYDLSDVCTVLLTHIHADHCGLARWLQDHGASVAIHPLDGEQIPPRYRHPDLAATATQRWIDWTAAPAEVADAARDQTREQASKCPAFAADMGVGDGDVLAHGRFRLEIAHTPGHTAGSVIIYEPSAHLLFTGDTLFPRSAYSPTLRPFSPRSAMADYLASLDRMTRYDAELALPAHQEPFRDLRTRLAQVTAHHQRRAAEVGEIVRSSAPLTAWSVAQRLRRKRSWEGLPVAAQLSATGEACAHLVRLADADSIEEQPGRPSLWRARSDP